MDTSSCLNLKFAFVWKYLVFVVLICAIFSSATKEGIQDTCHPNPCFNGGNCTIQSNATFNCTCDTGFYGPKCNETVCNSSPCLNGGICKARSEIIYHCYCDAFYSGSNCEKASPCLSRPCRNGGTCGDVDHGKDQNHGSCVMDGNCNPYHCACISNYIGVNCEIDMSGILYRPITCQDMKCNSRQYCTTIYGLTVCRCKPGYDGDQCQRNVSSSRCVDQPCLNGGTCRPSFSPTGYDCSCRGNYFGLNCEKSSSVCQSKPCLNGGACFSIPASKYICMCPWGYFGNNCEINSFSGTSGASHYPSSTCITATTWFLIHVFAYFLSPQIVYASL